ncbi:LysR family transcriptional regulator [Pseudomonas eucalypticola]|uniref:LysR family transcriptional regulator n=1 Tax=Pseudomonas eucalypticola TaxID=2599595 RepID=A0A7D5D8W8_9PSED|nr:LysR family transcriptional regulator [Pseudomonas eucalypticola]QKZ05657.1 LysR family transcriptional regulator [Pseudomonas eucalypticola]
MDYFAALTAFIEAADGNNFSRAAERLGIKASTVSRYVKDLEQDLGIALFNRSTRTLHLTEGGQTFLHHARRVLAELEQARAATGALNQHPRGLLKVSVPPAFCRHHVLPWLGDFQRRYPDIQVELVLDDARVNLIESGMDLAIRRGTLPDSGLKARKLASEQWVLCVGTAFAAGHAAPEAPQRLADYPAILGAPAADEVVFCREHARVTVTLQGALRINDLDARRLAVEQGLGVALLPCWLAADGLGSGRLQRWLADWQVPSGEAALWFVYPPKRIVSSKVRSFIDFMVERIGTPPYWLN